MKTQIHVEEIGQDVLFRVLRLKDNTPVGVIVSVSGGPLAAMYFRRLPETRTLSVTEFANSTLWPQLIRKETTLGELELSGIYAEHFKLEGIVRRTVAGSPEGALHAIYVDEVLQPNGITDSEDLIYMPAAA